MKEKGIINSNGETFELNTLSGTPIRGLCGATLAFFAGFAAVSLFAPSVLLFKNSMGLTPVMVGLLGSMPILSGSLLRIPFSAMADSNGGRKPILILLFLSLIGMLGLFILMHMYYPGNMSIDLYPILLILGLLCGCGVAIFSSGITQTSYWFPQKKQGYALGIFAGVGNLSPGIFGFLFPIAFVSLGLSGTYLSWLIFLFLSTILYLLIGKNAWYFQLIEKGNDAETAKYMAHTHYKQEIFPKGNTITSLLLSGKNSKTWLLLVIYFTTFGGFLAMAVWLPTYWVMFHELTLKTAVWLAAIFAIIASLTRVIGGKISDKFSAYSIVVISLLLMLIGTFGMAMSHEMVIDIVALVLMAIGMGIANAAVFKLVPQEIPDAIGGATGWIGGLGAIGGFIIINIMTLFVKTNEVRDAGYAYGFSVFGVLILFSLIAVAILKRRQIIIYFTPFLNKWVMVYRSYFDSE